MLKKLADLSAILHGASDDCSESDNGQIVAAGGYIEQCACHIDHLLGELNVPELEHETGPDDENAPP